MKQKLEIFGEKDRSKISCILPFEREDCIIYSCLRIHIAWVLYGRQTI